MPENRVYQYNYGYRYTLKIIIEVGNLGSKPSNLGVPYVHSISLIHGASSQKTNSCTGEKLVKGTLLQLILIIPPFSWEYVLTSNRLAMIRLWFLHLLKEIHVETSNTFSRPDQVDQTVDQRPPYGPPKFIDPMLRQLVLGWYSKRLRLAGYSYLRRFTGHSCRYQRAICWM